MGKIYHDGGEMSRGLFFESKDRHFLMVSFAKIRSFKIAGSNLPSTERLFHVCNSMGGLYHLYLLRIFPGDEHWQPNHRAERGIHPLDQAKSF